MKVSQWPPLYCSGMLKVIKDPERVPEVTPWKRKHLHLVSIALQYSVEGRGGVKQIRIPSENNGAWKEEEESGNLQTVQGRSDPKAQGPSEGGGGIGTLVLPCQGLGAAVL